MSESFISIAQAAEQLGVTLRTIRFYEERGLVDIARAEGTTRRLISASNLERLQFIIRSRRLRFTLQDLKRILQSAKKDGVPQLTKEQIEDQVRFLIRLRDDISLSISALSELRNR